MPHRTVISHLSHLFRSARRGAGLAAFGAAVAIAGAGALHVPDAQAQGVRSKGEPTAASKRRATADKSARKSAKAMEAAERAPSGPLVINVSLSRQRLTVYDATNKPIVSSPVSSGRRGHATPTGVFTVLQKRRHHISNIYNVAMPNMQRLTWSGIALHAGALPGYPASSGCIRLPHGFSRQLFGMTKLGTRVIVTRDPVSPVAIAHERLFNAYPEQQELAQRDPDTRMTQVADASHAASGASDTVSAVLGVSTAHASEAHDAKLPASRLRFLAKRQTEAQDVSREIREAGYARAEKSALLTQVQRAAEAARAPLGALRATAERLDDELKGLEKAIAGAHREIESLENPAPAKGNRRSKRKALSESERAQRIAELRTEIADAEPEVSALRVEAGKAGEALAAAEAVAREAERERKAAMNALSEANAAMKAALAKERAIGLREAKRDVPVSVFVSRERQRLYVRQGYDDIFDVEVSIEGADEPIGTHVFTALDYAPEIHGMTWSVVSVPHEPSRSSAARTQRSKTAAKGKDDIVPPAPRRVQTASAALDRITIPEYAREAIADVMKPGSSLVISDLRIGNETGKYTDFIVPIR